MESRSAGLMVRGSIHDSMTRPGISFARPTAGEEGVGSGMRLVAHADYWCENGIAAQTRRERAREQPSDDIETSPRSTTAMDGCWGSCRVEVSCLPETILAAEK